MGGAGDDAVPRPPEHLAAQPRHAAQARVPEAHVRREAEDGVLLLLLLAAPAPPVVERGRRLRGAEARGRSLTVARARAELRPRPVARA